MNEVLSEARATSVLPLDAKSGSAFLRVEGLCLEFPIYHGGARSLKRTMMSAASGRLGPARASVGGEAQATSNRVVVQALREVSFSLRAGDRLGIVGHNGAGKSTLLRAMAGIYEPVAGRVHASGSLHALLDPGSGLNLDLTGRENIVLRGRYKGMDAAAIRRLEDDVQEFAALGEFIELPVRTYSSGMVVRLAFGLATAIAPQILLMDEWFMAGDAAFRDKAHARLENVVRGAEILVLTSHMLPVLKSWCNRVLWLESGRIRADGAPEQILPAYLGALG